VTATEADVNVEQLVASLQSDVFDDIVSVAGIRPTLEVSSLS
jgi:hypothetical protein